jgi:hypothetical protein
MCIQCTIGSVTARAMSCSAGRLALQVVTEDEARCGLFQFVGTVAFDGGNDCLPDVPQYAVKMSMGIGEKYTRMLGMTPVVQTATTNCRLGFRVSRQSWYDRSPNGMAHQECSPELPHCNAHPTYGGNGFERMLSDSFAWAPIRPS